MCDGHKQCFGASHKIGCEFIKQDQFQGLRYRNFTYTNTKRKRKKKTTLEKSEPLTYSIKLGFNPARRTTVTDTE